MDQEKKASGDEDPAAEASKPANNSSDAPSPTSCEGSNTPTSEAIKQKDESISCDPAKENTVTCAEDKEICGDNVQAESKEPKDLSEMSRSSEQHSNVEAIPGPDAENTAPDVQQTSEKSERTAEAQINHAENEAAADAVPQTSGEKDAQITPSEKPASDSSQSGASLAQEDTPPSDNQNTSVASSPTSGSASGQDSGVSPDDSASDTGKSPAESGIVTVDDAGKETKLEEVTKSVVEGVPADISTDAVSQPQTLSHSHTNMSSDTNTSISETQVTVSDLESPPAAHSTTASEIAAAAAAGSSDQESVYYIKWIMFGQNNVPIITQNENGPCPLLAIMNVLLLKEKVKLAPMLEMITSEQLMTYLGECIFENMPQNLSETTQANYEQNMQDAMGVMYKLQTGLDVNVKFTGVSDFEYTPELIVFDLLEISLYHGWLVDPQDPKTVEAVNQCSYNQLVEKIISLKHSETEENVTQALIAEQFLERTASQLTYHGLCELSSVVKEKELCVFFRNNHFNTLYKHNNELFLLVTDQGFLTESNVVWETLSNVDGDCHFTDATFRTYTRPPPSTDPIPDPCVPVGSPEQIDHDYQVALFLQEEASSMQNPAWGGNYQQEPAAIAQADLEYAMRLQEEENRRALAEQQRAAAGAAQAQGHPQQQARPQGPGAVAEGQRRRGERPDRTDRREKEEKSCSIL